MIKIQQPKNSLAIISARKKGYARAKVDARLCVESSERDIYRAVELIPGEKKICNVHLLFFFTMVVSVPGNVTLYIFMPAPTRNGHSRKTLMTPVA